MYFIKPSIRNKIRQRDNCKCCYCGKHVPRRNGQSLDHVIPRYHGGTDTPDNLVLTCVSCNSRKGHKSLKEYCEYLVLEGIMSYRSSLNIIARVNNRLSKELI